MILTNTDMSYINDDITKAHIKAERRKMNRQQRRAMPRRKIKKMLRHINLNCRKVYSSGMKHGKKRIIMIEAEIRNKYMPKSVKLIQAPDGGIVGAVREIHKNKIQ